MPKIMIDPVYTQDLHRCASTVKIKACVEHLLHTREDVFFYWFIPLEITESEQEWLPKSNRIQYIPMPYFEDRYKEYWHSSDEWRRAVSFSGPYWDVDVLVTNRTSLVPYLQWAMRRPAGILTWSKKVFLIEDMPIMSFKKFIPQSTERGGDLSTIMGYLQSDLTCISAYWEKKHIIDIAKNYFAPSQIKYLRDRIIEASPRIHDAPRLKSIDAIKPMLLKERKFTISYAGRMVNRDMVDDSFDVMMNHWIVGGEDTRIILCTVSANFGRVNHPLIKHIEQYRPDREEFWRIMREESDVGVFFSRDEDYSMAMMEPIIQGTPLVVHRSEHAVASLGEHYPFFVNNTKEGYAMVKRFKEDYMTMYSIFAEWSKTHFTDLLRERNKDYIPHYLEKVVNSWDEDFAQATSSLSTNSIVQLIAQHAPKDEPFEIVPVIKELEQKKLLKFDLAWKEEGQFDGLRLTFSTHFDLFRLGLLQLGYTDFGPKAGWMRAPIQNVQDMSTNDVV